MISEKNISTKAKTEVDVKDRFIPFIRKLQVEMKPDVIRKRKRAIYLNLFQKEILLFNAKHTRRKIENAPVYICIEHLLHLYKYYEVGSR